MLWHSGLPKSERFFGQFFWRSELITIDDGVIFQDFFQIGEASRGYFDAIDQDVEGDKAGGEGDVEEVAVFVVA